MSSFALVLVGAGSGSRLGSDLPKALVTAAGAPLYQHSLNTAATLADLALVVMVCPPEHLHTVGLHAKLDHPRASLKLAAGGSHRFRSVVEGVKIAAHAGLPVLVHDVARPLASVNLYLALLDRLEGQQNLCVVPLLPVTDALKRAVGETVLDAPRREGYFLTQTPQGLSADLAEKLADDQHGDHADEAAWALGVGAQVAAVAGERANFKITYPEDLLQFEQRLKIK